MALGKARVFTTKTTNTTKAIQLNKAGDPLTPREREVAALLCEGLSNKLVGDRIGVSEHTAKFHINAVMLKLGAHTRTEAAMRFHAMTHKCVPVEATS